MSRTKTAAPPPSVDEIRNYWRSLIVSTSTNFAGLLEWIPPTETDLRKIPAHAYPHAIGKCRELLDKACLAESRGESRACIQQRMNAELWNFLKMLAPSPRFPAVARNDIGMTSEMFSPHEDTAWPSQNR